MKRNWNETHTINGMELVLKSEADQRLNLAWGLIAFLNVIMWGVLLFGRG